MLAALLQLAEAVMVATTLSIGIVATGAAVVTGEEPPDFSGFVQAIQPPYESDDKRIYPEVLDEEEKLPPEEKIKNEPTQ